MFDFYQNFLILQTLCRQLTYSKSKKVQNIGAIIYASLFDGVTPMQQEIVTDLLVHVTSAQKDESHFALTALEKMDKKMLQKHSVYLKSLLEADIFDHSLNLIRRIYALVASIAEPNDSRQGFEKPGSYPCPKKYFLRFRIRFPKKKIQILISDLLFYFENKLDIMTNG